MRGLLDLLFPVRCPGCRALVGPGQTFCRPCSETFAELGKPHCARCCEPGVAGLCEHCALEPPAFAASYVPFLYGGALADAVHRFKYEDRAHYARPLALTALDALEDDWAWCDLVTPVPLHVRRLRQRGYDQALLLARVVAAEFGKPVAPRAARRVRDTASQVGRDRKQRALNVAGAFAGDTRICAGKRVLLVDDVLTTGATGQAAASALRAAGAAEVRLFALARAVSARGVSDGV